MKYQIRFTDGEFQGHVFPIGATALSIGRSHSNVIHLQTADVSGKHVNLTLTDKGILLENFSSRVTTVDDAPVAMGDRVNLVAGQVIGLGSVVKFTLEALPDTPASDMKTPPAPSGAAKNDDDATVPPVKKAPSGAVKNDDDATVPPVKMPTAQSGVSMKTPPAPSGASKDDDATVPPVKTPPVASGSSTKRMEAQSSAKKKDDDATVPPAPKASPKQSKAAKAAPAPAQNMKAAEAPSPASSDSDDDSNETISMQTRMASAEELEYMKSSHEKRKMRKTGIMLFAIISVIAIAVTVYFCFYYNPPEKDTSWPKDKAGKELSKLAQMDKSCPYANSLGIKYPDVPGATVKQEPGKLTVVSRLGKYRDVPLRLTMEYFQDRKTLLQNREATLKAWMATKTSSSENWNFDLIDGLMFYRVDHGIPYLRVHYSRTENNESYVGYAVQIRIADWVFILQKEIPTRDRYRAEWFIERMAFLSFAPDLTSTHWEGTDTYQKGNLTGIIAEARAWMRRKSTTVWQKAEYLIRSALVQAPQTPEGKQIVKDALELLKELRAAQIKYYNAQKTAYLLARIQNNKREQQKITNELKAVFTSEEDRRFHNIRQDKWD